MSLLISCFYRLGCYQYFCHQLLMMFDSQVNILVVPGLYAKQYNLHKNCQSFLIEFIIIAAFPCGAHALFLFMFISPLKHHMSHTRY